MNDIKISFGIIVLNGEPFTRYCVRALYPYAHQIIIVEGATLNATSISMPNGHSIDGTLDILRDIKTNSDPEDKITIITAEDEGHPNGFWPGEKDEMSNAYAQRCSGNWLWQVDVDEFYLPESIETMISYLESNPNTSAATFDMITFWGALDVIVDGYYLRNGARYYHRLFKWRPDYRYISHRPPTVVDETGRDLRKLEWLNGNMTTRLGVKLLHYSLLFPKQVLEKSKYYEKAMRPESVNWATHNYFNLSDPFRVHNVFAYPSWLERYTGNHPEVIHQMMTDIDKRTLMIERRPMDDAYRLLNSISYRLYRILYKIRFHIKIYDFILHPVRSFSFFYNKMKINKNIM